MDYKYIEQLLDRYWNCETSPEEEAILRAFFSQSDVPVHLLRYKPLFAYAKKQAEAKILGEDFDRRVMEAIQAPIVKAHPLTLASRFDLSSIIGSELAITTYAFNSFDISLLQGKDIERSRMLALLYYTGYLTIAKASSSNKIILAFPNREVASSFTGNLLSRHLRKDPDEMYIWLADFIEAAENGDAEEMRRKLDEYFSAFSYELIGDERERFYHGIFHSIFVIASLFALSEDRGMRGRADEVLIAGSHIWIFELKVDRTADEALGRSRRRDTGTSTPTS